MNLSVSLLPKQLQFVNSTKPTTLYCGGVGAGKTIAEIVLALKLSLDYPGIDVLVCSPTYRMLKDTIIREAENIIPSTLLSQYIKTPYPEFVFKKRFGKTSKILFRAFDDPGKVKGLTVGSAIIDELTEIKKPVYDEIIRRIRQSGMPNRVYATTNPGLFENWVYQNIVNVEDEDINYIHTNSFDNYTLPANYLKRLKNLEKNDLAQYNRSVLGLWGNFAQDTIGAFPFIDSFTTPYRVAFIDPGFSDNTESDHTSVAIVGIVPEENKESSEWEIQFTGKSWEKSITNIDVQRELILFLDKYKPIDSCLESQLSTSTKLFIDSFKRTESELKLRVKNNWSFFHQVKNKHERIMQEVASNKYRMKVLKETESSFLNPVINYSKIAEYDDEPDSVAGGVYTWYNSKALQNYIKYEKGLYG